MRRHRFDPGFRIFQLASTQPPRGRIEFIVDLATRTTLVVVIGGISLSNNDSPE